MSDSLILMNYPAQDMTTRVIYWYLKGLEILCFGKYIRRLTILCMIYLKFLIALETTILCKMFGYQLFEPSTLIALITHNLFIFYLFIWQRNSLKDIQSKKKILVVVKLIYFSYKQTHN